MPSVSQRGIRCFDICKRDDVGQLVPERRLPAERSRRPGTRGVERHDAAEAGAERADHAGQPEVAHGEVVVVREDLDEDRDRSA